VKLGVGLPTHFGNLVRGADVLDCARLADDAGFHSVTVHDRPNHETWEPLAALAAVAAVTQRVRLLSGVLLLPARDEALVAKQAAVIDQVSGGRLDLGVAVGVRPDDFELLGREMGGRGRRFEHQIERLEELWAAANAGREEGTGPGPGTIQQPHPPLWIGGYTDAAVRRAVERGHGYMFGAPGLDAMAARIPYIRETARAAGRTELPIGGLAYILPTDDPRALEAGETLLRRYYGALRKPFREMVITGTTDEVVEAVRRYEAAGVDVLHLHPVSTSPRTVERLAVDVLPAFAAPGA
jgi:alkanesulfonate monooxygenase SsuD/methylene tetrahydromethanopterin reductase-like flavin-dependent oxidoreductase (luciferase family)